MENKILLSVLGFSFNQDRTGAYGLVMAEQGGERRLMIVIGTPEAQSIAFSLQNSKPPRPLTHDVFYETLSLFGIELLEVHIYKYEAGVFFAQLTFKQENKEIIIESRTSDGIGLALRTQSPIYTTEGIMRELGVVVNDNTPSDGFSDLDHDDSFNPDYSLLSDVELKTVQENAVKGENYELASLLRDEMRKRTNS